MTRLLSLFCALCALIAILFAAYDALVVAGQQRWPATVGVVDRADVHIDHPFASDGGGTTYQVKAIVSADGRLFTIWSSSAYRADVMDRWVERHPRGSQLAVRIDPDSRHAILADPEDLPMEHHPKQDLILFAIAASAAIVLWWLPIPRRRAQSPGRSPASAP